MPLFGGKRPSLEEIMAQLNQRQQPAMQTGPDGFPMQTHPRVDPGPMMDQRPAPVSQQGFDQFQRDGAIPVNPQAVQQLPNPQMSPEEYQRILDGMRGRGQPFARPPVMRPY